MAQNEFFNAKCRITLRTVNSIYVAIRWAVERNRKFSVVTNDLALGWSFDVDVLPNENINELEEVFNNGKKTETPTN